MKRIITTCLLFLTFAARSQSMRDFADSVRVKYGMPELSFAVVSSEAVLEIQHLGVRRAGTKLEARTGDRFHIGSNTKAVTAFIAALLVKQKLLNWNTKFFALFPEWKAQSRKAYWSVALQHLLTFRGKLPAYTYSFAQPDETRITGTDAEQRLQLARYFLSRRPMKPENGLTPSNADYILAGLMLERAAKRPYKDLVTEFGKGQGIEFGFDYPNLTDTLQPWGHDAEGKALPPAGNPKLNWLLAAGNINLSLEDYIKFIQLQLKGLEGRSSLLSAQEFEQLLFGLPVFSFGWFSRTDEKTGHHIAYNEGNAGAFITAVEIVKETGRAFIIFTNAATPETKNGVQVLMRELHRKDARAVVSPQRRE